MAGLRFGTDGVRGRAFDELSEELAWDIGRAAAKVLRGSEAVVGRDPRESGPLLRDAMAAGLVAGGVEPLDLGVAPTPAVAYVAARRGAIGVMISASHNRWHDNGIKLFTSTGTKLSDDDQAAIEQRLDAESIAPRAFTAPSAVSGRPILESIQADVGDWVRSVVATIDDDLTGLSVVLDAANGAASHVVAPALADLGAKVTAIAVEPDGRNINERCGSTHLDGLAAAVLDTGADMGVALDGDADRLVCVDHRGNVVDGDKLMAIVAVHLQAQARLRDDRVVVTVMSNLGLHRAMADAGIAVHVTPVGDRHILEALTTNRWSFGGEQSGHLIFGDLATTGDGFLSALQVMSIVKSSGRDLADLADNAMTTFPQVLRNVRVAERVTDPVSRLAVEIEAAETKLGDMGRVLIRASGTEPVIRVMVEAADSQVADSVCASLCEAVEAKF